MRTRVLVAAAALLAVTLSGCTEAGYLNPYGAPADDDPVVDDGNQTGNQTGNETAPPGQNGTPPAPAPQGTFTITPPANFTVNETFEVQLNYYYPGNEPVAPTYNETGNMTDPGDPGTPAYHDDVWWVLNVTQGNQTLSFNGTAVPAKVPMRLNLSVNATLHATYQREDVHLEGKAEMPMKTSGAVAGGPVGPEPIVLTGTVVAPVSPSAVGLGCPATALVDNGIDGAFYTFDESLEGWSYAVTNTMTAAFWVYWYDDAFNVVADGDSGVVPAGATSADVCVDVAVPGSTYTFTITPP